MFAHVIGLSLYLTQNIEILYSTIRNFIVCNLEIK